MKSMCHDARRNSPSVADFSPTSRCIATTSRIASSSAAFRPSSSRSPLACCARASSSFCGRSRLPTWSARNGGVSRSATALGRALEDDDRDLPVGLLLVLVVVGPGRGHLRPQLGALVRRGGAGAGGEAVALHLHADLRLRL